MVVGEKMWRSKKNFILVGPLPPPIHGESIALDIIVNSSQLKKFFNIKVRNTNRKNLDFPGRLSIGKLLADLLHLFMFTFLVISLREKVIYISISQTKLGLIRDCLFILIGKYIGKGKIITHLHGNNLGNVIDDTAGLLNKLIRKSFKNIDIGIVLGEKLTNNYRGLVERVEIVSNGISADFIAEHEVNFTKKSKSLSVLYLSNLMAEKGYGELVEAITSLVREGLDIKLDLIGGIHDQQHFKKVQTYIKEHSMEEQILYHGVKIDEDKKEHLLNTDVMVLPTKYKVEGQPISIIEGMAAGLPIVSTDRGVIAELIDHCGIIVNPTVEEIKKAILKLYIYEDYRQELGRNSRQKFEEHYTAEKYIESLMHLFCENTLEGNSNYIFKESNNG